MISLLCHFWVVMRQNTIPNSVVEQSCPPYYRKEVEGSMQLGWECAIFFQGVPFLQLDLPPIKSIKLRFFFLSGIYLLTRSWTSGATYFSKCSPLSIAIKTSLLRGLQTILLFSLPQTCRNVVHISASEGETWG